MSLTGRTVGVTLAGPGRACPRRTARTVAVPADGAAREWLRRPGRVFPLRARAGGAHVRAGPTETPVDLVRACQR
ncbi:3,4-dihydroxy-2-butanone-4-phosphate synthase [Candidatus Protofrankia californiensis]|uniref:3,4-dihydroxy-2-butanone-4-phosphate synthase n=1 Tax=Candidatus Protofrankia californiensis TaxID=1839754 RepID=UPI001040EC0E|nr:3,4-dihydroxy-2-butanone-4-phosphate synthase [Candidatus Protofrankia californiensis]